VRKEAKVVVDIIVLLTSRVRVVYIYCPLETTHQGIGDHLGIAPAPPKVKSIATTNGSGPYQFDTNHVLPLSLAYARLRRFCTDLLRPVATDVGSLIGLSRQVG
jgi:hypothetical protein